MASPVYVALVALVALMAVMALVALLACPLLTAALNLLLPRV